jgi:predicted nicotinamide N-methyase
MPTPQEEAKLEATVRRLTEVEAPALCPEVGLRLKRSSERFETFRERLPAAYSAVPPYWSVAWPGGQALARYILDNPLVSGLHVADIGAGSGLASIAAMMAGALSARAIDRDPLALAAARINARHNGVTIDVACEDLATTHLGGVHVVLAGDLWYELFTARRSTALLRRLAREHKVVLAGDPRRSHFPRSRRELLATYQMAATEDLERAAIIVADVWRLLP